MTAGTVQGGDRTLCGTAARDLSTTVQQRYDAPWRQLFVQRRPPNGHRNYSQSAETDMAQAGLVMESQTELTPDS